MTLHPKLRKIVVLTLGALAATSASARTEIQNKGSDTLVNAAQSLAEQYGKLNPKVAVAVSGGGSGTGIAAMINGTVDIANSSRKMSEKEIKEAQAKGRQPVEHIIGYDALAIFVHKNFPGNSITLSDLARIYGRDGGAGKWSDLGITIPGCKGDIVVVSRQNNSGTYAYFREAVLGEKGKFRQGTLDMHGSKDVADLVEKTPCAIGYSGLAYVTDHMKALCVASAAGKPCIKPTEQTAFDGTYPIARPLFMYTNGEPAGEVKKYLDWIKSNTGQCIIEKEGYAPIKKTTCK
ncbi:MAG TPA: phosphate ABC transporter substrate-binding protein [Accumulibacter sp.]|uniref:phosphate ABC transporter substrate-binding protein n=1 Tax=Accumulibacter sp. TaxID=2053492 RepID=UPI0028786E78|nr:phosphate ABC transporter substrate-binding protein [Accumulibacter sp.]MDS4055926.1 phosphate ABC transporter substrate-binding protein [Accumulibacter sp.]HMV04364.1 phosphate ABC transporter substrate-binding protein [Accumulibacter sp.]HMW63036.1 phosphate ABC transporter substrate-binding protein [Accumulibacter sp.]HMW79267.1 phosphate ABC transporter substrate-binding protein [Accumulibacter sp.]HMX67435.1 phosphate ABC transporter substrate-binding protein [Accumulibacter sp.]